MRITSDNFSIYVAVLCAGASCIGFLICAAWRKLGPESRLGRFARGSYLVCFVSFAYASVYLLTQLLSNARYDIAYIHDYSAPTDELIYRVSAFWAGQQGSLLLWALIAAAIGAFLLRGRRASALTMCFWASVVTFMGVLLVVSDPFAKLAGYQPGMTGAGLNPLLKNPWMAIHPPVIFLGYAALIVPAAFAFGALMEGDGSRWVRRCMPWALFGWVSLSAGIILGMVWSYEVLGWGGYWGWDPIENASLVPWLISTALVHGLLLQRNRNRMARANVALAFAAFLAVILATFLTRSGILSDYSVHSFVDFGAQGYLSGFLAGYFVLCVFALLVRWNSIRAESPALNLRPRDLAVSAGVVTLVAFAFTVLAGTVYPLFARATLRPEFYTHLAIPIAAVVLVLMAIAQFSGRMRWPAIVAHTGVALLVLGVVASSMGSSRTLRLTKGGSSKEAAGCRFAYVGKRSTGAGMQVAVVRVTRAGEEFDAGLRIERTERGSVRSPYIKSGPLGDLYISPRDVRDTVITPAASVRGNDWGSIPARVPGTHNWVSLLGMQVEEDLARLEYQPESGRPIQFSVSVNRPARVDGYTFEMRRIFVNGGKDHSVLIAGAELAVSGRNLPDKAVIQVSTKPLMWVLWLGTALIVIGGAIAALRRYRESVSAKDELLSDIA